MAAIEPVNIEYILSYVDRGLRRAMAEDRAMRNSVVATGTTIDREAAKQVRASATEQRANRAKVASYVAVAQAATAGSAEQVTAYNMAAAAATRAGAADEARGLQAVAAAAVTDEALAAQAQAAVSTAALQVATGRRVVESYLQVAAAATRGSTEQRVAYEQAAAAARAYGMQVVAANEKAVASHKAAGHAAQVHGREERGVVRGLGAFHGSGVGGIASGAFLGGFAIGEFAHGIVETTQEVQVNTALLQQALENQDVPWERWGDHITENIEKLSSLSGFLRGPLLEGLAQMVRVTGGDVPQALKDQAVATDLARARHMDLGRATMIVSRAQLGLVGPLARFGINITKVTTAQDALRDSHAKVTSAVRRQAIEYDKHATGLAAIDQLQKQVAGSSARYMSTAAGSLANYHRAIEDLQVALGRELMPVLAATAQHLADWIDHLRETGRAQQIMHTTLETVKGVVQAILPPLRLVAAILTPIIDTLTGIRMAAQFIVTGLIARAFLRWAVSLRASRVAVALLGAAEATTAAETKALTGTLILAEDGTLKFAAAQDAAAASTLAQTGRIGRLVTALKGLRSFAGMVIAFEVIEHRRQISEAGNSAANWLARGASNLTGGAITPHTFRYGAIGYFTGLGNRDWRQANQQNTLLGANPWGGVAGLVPGSMQGRQIYSDYLHNQSVLHAAQPQAPFSPAQIVRNVLQPAREAIARLTGEARTGAINGIVAAYVRDVHAGRDNFLRRAFAHEAIRMLPEDKREEALKELQKAYIEAALESRGKVDGAVWAARLAGLPPAVQAAVRAALAKREQVVNQHAIDAVLHAADRAQAGISALQGAGQAQIAIGGMDPNSAGAIGIQQQVQQATIGRLRGVQATLQAALARTKPGFAKYNEIEQRLQDIGTQILQATASIADLAGQAIMAGLDSIAARIQQQNAALQAGAGLAIARAGYQSGSLAAVRVDQRLQQGLLANLQQLAGAISSRLGRANASHHEVQAAQLEQQLSDVQNQITGVLTQQAEDVHAAADAIRAGRARQRQQRLAASARLVTVAGFYEQLQEGRLQMLQTRQQLAGVAGTPAAGAAQAEFINRNIIPALRRQQVQLRRELRTQLREGDRAGARDTRTELQRVANALLAQQLAAMQAVKENTAKTVDVLSGNLTFGFHGQAFTDDLANAGTGAS